MKKLLFSTLLLSQLIFSATPEQVEQYIMVTNTEAELLQLESSFSRMQNRISKKDSDSPLYDTQLFTVRFREYLQQHLSDSEMEKVLENHIDPTMQKFVAASSDPESDPKSAATYVKSLEQEPESQIRIDIVEKINEKYYDKDAIVMIFDDLILPIMERMKPKNSKEDYTKKARERYIKAMLQNAKEETLYVTREFSIEELEELLKVVQTPAMGYEVKAVYGGMVYAMQEFFEVMASKMGHVRH